MNMNLGSIPPGTVARIVRVSGGGPLRKRLVEMGVLPGVVVEVVRFAPLGDPMEVRIRGMSLSLRRREASSIEVQIIDRPPPAQRGHRHRHRNGRDT